MPIGSTLPPYAPLVEGKEIGGTILEFRVQQKSDYDTNRPLYFVRTPSGSVTKGFEPFDEDGKPNEPICDWVFTLDVGVPDENGETERRVFIDPRKGQRGTAVEGKRGRDAIEIALKKAGAHRVGLEIGGQIWFTRGPKVAPKKGDAACVTYTARYAPPPDVEPGSGTPVDEVPFMIGGSRFNPNERELVVSRGGVAFAGSAGATTTASGLSVGLGGGGGAMIVTAPREEDEPPF
jgi:hypothetical protein